MTDGEPHLLVAREGALVILTFNRPEARNALSEEMKDALVAATRDCERDEAVRAVLIRAEGETFMAGGDIKGFARNMQADPAAYAAAFEPRIVAVHQILYQLRRMPKPVVVAAQGGIAGIGMSVLMAADLAVVADDAFFTLAYRHIGLCGDGCATYLLPRIVGERRALEIALLGERFGAEEAKSLGLVNRVVPRAELDAEARRLATALAEGPTVALAHAKRLIRNSWDASWDEQSHREAEAMAACATTADHREGVAAFIEKRTPRFTGR
jgi:2-(1,2-epoxy-1,2-dihydrophenyl)acetyl-CoA isomerase